MNDKPTLYPMDVAPGNRASLVSSVRLEEEPGHDVLHVWNQGGKAGTLTVNKGDGALIAERLIPDGEWWLRGQPMGGWDE